jgi:hypothetical protein
MTDFLKNYAYHILDFFLPVIIALIYFPWLFSGEAEKLLFKLWGKVKERCNPSGSN